MRCPSPRRILGEVREQLVVDPGTEVDRQRWVGILE
eukprot:COSAG02_NODE_36787_length_450_cov_1.068376_2_plen_35_part_01